MNKVTLIHTAQFAGAWYGPGAVLDVDDDTKASLTQAGTILSDADHNKSETAKAAKAKAKKDAAPANGVRPSKKADRLVAIQAAHLELIKGDPDKANTANWMTDNPRKPECKALEGILRWGPNADDRDAAFDLWLETQTAPPETAPKA